MVATAPRDTLLLVLRVLSSEGMSTLRANRLRWLELIARMGGADPMVLDGQLRDPANYIIVVDERLVVTMAVGDGVDADFVIGSAPGPVWPEEARDPTLLRFGFGGMRRAEVHQPTGRLRTTMPLRDASGEVVAVALIVTSDFLRRPA